MKPKIAVLVDSSSDVPQEVLAAHANVMVVPAVVTFGDQEYLDRVNITPAEFFAKLAVADELPRTASPAPYAVEKALGELVEQGYTEIIALTVAEALSATYQSFKIAANQFPNVRIEVINTKSIGIGSGQIAAYALRLIDTGLNLSEVITRVHASVAPSRCFFYIPTLKYLRAGGRIGRVAGLLGSVLNIKPVISCDPEGVYYPVAKARSESKAINKMIDLALDGLPDSATVAVAYGTNRDLAEVIAHRIEARTGRPVDFIGDISPALGVHVGPDLLGITTQVPG